MPPIGPPGPGASRSARWLEMGALGARANGAGPYNGRCSSGQEPPTVLHWDREYAEDMKIP